jgi:hypothetical protein
MTFSLFDVVSLVQDLPVEGLHAGMIGAVIEVYTQPVPAYEVEFCDPSGRTIAQLALLPEQLRLTGDSRG